MIRERTGRSSARRRADGPSTHGGSAQRGPPGCIVHANRMEGGTEPRAQKHTGQQTWWQEGEVKKEVEERSAKTNLALSYKLTELATLRYNLSSYWHTFLANIVSSRQVAIQLS